MKILIRFTFALASITVLTTVAAAQINDDLKANPTQAASSAAMAAGKPDREAELLDRIEKLERKLAQLEGLVETAGLLPARSTAPASSGLPDKIASAKADGPKEPAPDPAAGTARTTAKQDKPKFLEEGIIPHSVRIPGTDLSLQFGGYVKVDVNQDLDSIGNQSQFATSSIPVRGTSNADLGSATTIQAKETRFTMALVGGEGAKTFKAYVETDFYGDNNTLRFRHAYAEYAGFLGGQTWTTFMDISARPRSLDYEGPDGEMFVRQAMIRYTRDLSKEWQIAFAAEAPTVQIATPSGFTGSARGNVPDFTGFLRYHQKRFHTQFAWVARNLRYDGTGTTVNESTFGWGLNSTFKLNTWGKDALMGQFGFGSGIGRYMEAMSGQNVDAFFSGNELVSLPARAAVLAYERHWTPKLFSAFAYSVSDVSRNSGLAGSVIKRTQDARVNLIWTPFKLVDFGVEYLWGRRDNQNGSFGDASRIMISSIYRFN